MNDLIIYAHPYEKSFCHGILQELQKNLSNADVIDLYRDEFDPILNCKDLELYHLGETSDGKILPYQERISRAERLIFIFPIWWYEAPAILKGFLDKVLLKGFAFTDENGFTGILNKEVVLITTSGDTTQAVEDPIRSLYEKGIFKSLGVSQFSWFNCETVDQNPSLREEFLKTINKI